MNAIHVLKVVSFDIVPTDLLRRQSLPSNELITPLSVKHVRDHNNDSVLNVITSLCELRARTPVARKGTGRMVIILNGKFLAFRFRPDENPRAVCSERISLFLENRKRRAQHCPRDRTPLEFVGVA